MQSGYPWRVVKQNQVSGGQRKSRQCGVDANIAIYYTRSIRCIVNISISWIFVCNVIIKFLFLYLFFMEGFGNFICGVLDTKLFLS